MSSANMLLLNWKKHTLDSSGKRRRNRPCLMSDSEVMTLLILFHTSRHRDLKSFYLGYVCHHMRKEFPHHLSYNRFVERQQKVGPHLLLFLQIYALGECSGISIIDSTPLASCHIKRAGSHRSMRGWAAKGKSTMGWFFGFKLSDLLRIIFCQRNHLWISTSLTRTDVSHNFLYWTHVE
mgnify:CR=1 FL=1